MEKILNTIESCSWKFAKTMAKIPHAYIVRGKHSVNGMSSMVFAMLKNGWADEDICNELGMEAEELLRLKHITGFSKLFADVEYKKAWETKNQILLRKHK